MNTIMRLLAILALLGALSSCGNPVVPQEYLVEQFFSTIDFSLVKEVNLRGYVLPDGAVASFSKYPAFVPLLDNPGQGVLVLPNPSSNNSYEKSHGVFWFPESDLRVSGDYSNFPQYSSYDVAGWSGWYIPQYTDYPFGHEPAFSMNLDQGSPLVSVVWANNDIYFGTAVADTFPAPAIDQRSSVAARGTTSLFYYDFLSAIFYTTQGYHLGYLGGISTGHAVYSTNATQASPTSLSPVYTTTPSETLATGSSSPNVIVDTSPFFPSLALSTGYNIHLPYVDGTTLDTTRYLFAYPSGDKQFYSAVYDGTTFTRLPDKDRYPLHAEKNKVLLEADFDGYFWLPEKSDKRIGAPGMKFLQAYRKDNGELWFLFSQSLRTGNGTTIRTWGYQY